MLPKQTQISAWMKKWLAWPRWAQISSATGLLILLTAGWMFAGESDQPSRPDMVNDPTLLVGSVFVKLMLVVLLVLAAAWIFSRVKIGSWKPGARQVQVLETTHLTARRSLHLVQIGNRKLLVGATDHTLNLLAELEDTPAGDPIPEALFSDFLSISTQASETRTVK